MENFQCHRLLYILALKINKLLLLLLLSSTLHSTKKKRCNTLGIKSTWWAAGIDEKEVFNLSETQYSFWFTFDSQRLSRFQGKELIIPECECNCPILHQTVNAICNKAHFLQCCYQYL